MPWFSKNLMPTTCKFKNRLNLFCANDIGKPKSFYKNYRGAVNLKNGESATPAPSNLEQLHEAAFPGFNLHTCLFVRLRPNLVC